MFNVTGATALLAELEKKELAKAEAKITEYSKNGKKSCPFDNLSDYVRENLAKRNFKIEYVKGTDGKSFWAISWN